MYSRDVTKSANLYVFFPSYSLSPNRIRVEALRKMTWSLNFIYLLVLGLTAFLSFKMAQSEWVSSRMARENRNLVPTLSVIGVVFGLFISFASADVAQRANNLRANLDREISAARSMFSIVSGIGPAANSVRVALTEYVQTVDALEWTWISKGAPGAAPADGAASSLILLTTIFAEKGKAEPATRSLVLGKIDELMTARTARNTNVKHLGDPWLWTTLVVMAMATQITGAIAFSGLRLQASVFLIAYTCVATVALTYLGNTERSLRLTGIDAQTSAMTALKSETKQ